MQADEELFGIATRLNNVAGAAILNNVVRPLEALEEAGNQIKRSFSGSWLGYHSRVYYADLAPKPPGANFSQEWGLKRLLGGLGSIGDWEEFDPEFVKDRIRAIAGQPDLKEPQKAAKKAIAEFNASKSEIMSILENELDGQSDVFLTRLKDDLDKLDSVSAFEVAQHWAPKGQIMTRDTLALGQGNKIPPHLDLLSEVVAIRHAFELCKAAAEISTKAASHLERKNRKRRATGRIGTNVFIGHGQSKSWRELKDFVQDRLGLPWDEFNRVPIAGVTNIARLSEMLDAAAIALLVMTAEDEMADGGVQARMNVVHEAGLFQGRLGFTKAIVLMEDGCTEFSNIQGLGQIRFPKGNIAASFEQIRRVLEREGLLGE
jgi:predicted nucleotide-binding protein